MLHVVDYAKHIYFDKRRDWNTIAERAMRVDYSWANSARKYEQLYDSMLGY